MLETDRLLLRPWQVSDAVVQREMWTERDPRVPPHRRIDADGHPTVEQLEERIRASAQPRLLVVQLTATGDVIGYCGLIDNSRDPEREPELAYEFLRRFWGQGFATEASWAVVAWAESMDYGRLWAGVREWNLASRRVLAKVGFVETGRVEPDSRYGDSLVTSKRLGAVTAQDVTLRGLLVCRDLGEAALVTALLPVHIALTRAEAGCLHFEVEATMDPLVWEVSERFSDSASFRAHQERVAASEWGRRTAHIERRYTVTD